MRPGAVDTIRVDEAALDTSSDGSILALADKCGVLLVEEQQFPALVRVRLRRNTL